MSDFFSALAARVVQRPGDGAAPSVRPRLPALFETAPPGAGEAWSDRPDTAEVARPTAAAPSAQDRASPIGRAEAPEAPPAPPWPSPPGESAVRVAAGAPMGAAPVLTHRPAPAATTHPAPMSGTAPSPTRTILAAVAGITTPAAPATPLAPEAIRADAAVRSEPATAVTGRPAMPQPPPQAAPAARIAQAAPPAISIAAPPPEPIIEVAIGRIEVRAAPAPVERRAAASAAPVMGLEEYLRSRGARSSR